MRDNLDQMSLDRKRHGFVTQAFSPEVTIKEIDISESKKLGARKNVNSVNKSLDIGLVREAR